MKYNADTPAFPIPMTPSPLTVSQLNRLARQALESQIPLLWVAGEVSNLTRAASGHVYFSLKDDSAQVRCVMFRSRAQTLPWRLENGQQVEAQVLVGLYEPRGDFQLNVEALRRSGQGALFEAFARLKEKLEREGLFAADRKRTLPRFPRALGVVTSSRGAALHDILATLARRAPHLPVIIYPTLVQGAGAASAVAQAIASASVRRECDLLLLARGGGSIEDLWAFNEETVARAIVAAPMPVISGVGHETDFTIADFAADQRAATPTAAAELASAGWFAARDELHDLADTLGHLLRRQLEARMQKLDLLAGRLLHPAQRLERSRRHLAHLQTRLTAAVARRLRREESHLSQLALGLSRQRPAPVRLGGHLALARQGLLGAAQGLMNRRRHALERLEVTLGALNPEATLARGYSIVRDALGHVVTDSNQLHPEDVIVLSFARGGARGRIEHIE
ncbi:exodeoxyribonuclease VII large subunit [Denitratisoma oestradiolicum]|uniref:Exodeoxyribonuclease 7 large subunit n=1 Tax=Denitratisoma oestradiolicum TaxID=311182 RepID=A0A6S6XWJ0_9PROT|nr:exodeoxyribonuclease VII large subunit [Denitratisoma oestradiolicum]TWO79292.1 exodeoxyribonuclease VII large subunit [Denitratisoma oestradiolicum]CAB1370384.1 Exodeoxyribonuclease 7 large subunit [Denitratisoma oestradiolicum]